MRGLFPRAFGIERDVEQRDTARGDAADTSTRASNRSGAGSDVPAAAPQRTRSRQPASLARSRTRPAMKKQHQKRVFLPDAVDRDDRSGSKATSTAATAPVSRTEAAAMQRRRRASAVDGAGHRVRQPQRRFRSNDQRLRVLCDSSARRRRSCPTSPASSASGARRSPRSRRADTPRWRGAWRLRPR